jgi:hypothetical protein
MSKSYASLYFRPGINNLEYPKKCVDNSSANCPKNIKTTSFYFNNGIVDETQTQSQRAATIINYYPGGRVSFGNENIAYSTPVTFLGKTEGQPGGLNRPPRNKF